MPEPTHEAVEALFQQATDLDPERRSAFLDEQCGGDLDLRAAVEELLHFDSEAESEPNFLASPAAQVRAALPLSVEPWVPSHIGRYRILRRHGEGGMGTVYEAEQDNPRRTVALKVIRAGYASAELLSRFRHEAEILARLQHPGIAQVYEAGIGDDGRPFFAMEFISGVPLDGYARNRGLDPAAILELLSKVCDAVQHAHDKGVIHRDLKPGNILVDASGQPKVLDFGVAHVAGADLLTTAGRTQAGQLLGTLSYMSPEQIAADPAGLDARSDVYTLGVILFELLARRLPYHLDKLPAHEVARVIQEQEPSRLGSIDTLYRGDVEIIVAKALEKDKNRRYASAGDLATDIRRYLRGEAILARPASALYQLRKFARRNKVLVAGVSGIFAALLVGTIVSIVFALRAADNARVANQREREATHESYRARIAAAAAAISRHDVADAARQLEAAPKALRDWEWQHLHRRLDDSIAVFPAAAGESQFLVRDPKGIRIARVTRSSLRITDMERNELSVGSFRPDTNLLPHPPLPTRRGLRLFAAARRNPIPGVALAVSDPQNDGILNVLDEEGRVQTQLQGPPGAGTDLVAVSPDGSRLAVCWNAQEKWTFTVYDADSGKPGATSAHDIGNTWVLVFNPDGTRIATGGEDGVTRLWDTSTGMMTAECRGHTRKVFSVAFRPDGLRLATASADGTVRQWDSTTGREVESPYDRHTGEVLTATFSADGMWIASGGTDRTVRVWLAANRQDLSVFQGHTGDVSDLAFTEDSRLASVSQSARRGNAEQEDGTVRLWEVGHDGAVSVLRGHKDYVYPVAYSPDGQWIASGGWDNRVLVWDALTGEKIAELPHPGNIRAVAFSPDSTWLVSGSVLDPSVRIWDVATAQQMNKFKGPGPGVVQAISVSPDGAHIAAADSEGNASIIDAATGAEVQSFRMVATEYAKKSLAYSPDGRLLAGTGEDGTQVDIRDAQTGRRSARLAGHTGAVSSVSFSGDGRLLASASADRTVRIWDVAASKCVALLTGHTDAVFSAVFHPDGKRLASAGRDRSIWLWDLATAKEVARLEGHANYVFSLAFSPDGRSLVSGSGDGTVRIWDTESPMLRHQVRREAEALQPDAERLVARLFTELHEPTQVVARLRADASLSDLMRHMAVREVMGRSKQNMP